MAPSREECGEEFQQFHDEYGCTAYTTLGAEREMDQSALKSCFLSRARRLHPDKGGDKRLMQMVNAAWDILKDPSKKELYDEFIASGPPHPEPDVEAGGEGAGKKWDEDEVASSITDAVFLRVLGFEDVHADEVDGLMEKVRDAEKRCSHSFWGFWFPAATVPLADTMNPLAFIAYFMSSDVFQTIVLVSILCSVKGGAALIFLPLIELFLTMMICIYIYYKQVLSNCEYWSTSYVLWTRAKYWIIRSIFAIVLAGAAYAGTEQLASVVYIFICRLVVAASQYLAHTRAMHDSWLFHSIANDKLEEKRYVEEHRTNLLLYYDSWLNSALVCVWTGVFGLFAIMAVLIVLYIEVCCWIIHCICRDGDDPIHPPCCPGCAAMALLAVSLDLSSSAAYGLANNRLKSAQYYWDKDDGHACTEAYTAWQLRNFARHVAKLVAQRRALREAAAAAAAAAGAAPKGPSAADLPLSRPRDRSGSDKAAAPLPQGYGKAAEDRGPSHEDNLTSQAMADRPPRDDAEAPAPHGQPADDACSWSSYWSSRSDSRLQPSADSFEDTGVDLPTYPLDVNAVVFIEKFGIFMAVPQTTHQQHHIDFELCQQAEDLPEGHEQASPCIRATPENETFDGGIYIFIPAGCDIISFWRSELDGNQQRTWMALPFHSCGRYVVVRVTHFCEFVLTRSKRQKLQCELFFDTSAGEVVVQLCLYPPCKHCKLESEQTRQVLTNPPYANIVLQPDDLITFSCQDGDKICAKSMLGMKELVLDRPISFPKMFGKLPGQPGTDVELTLIDREGREHDRHVVAIPNPIGISSPVGSSAGSTGFGHLHHFSVSFQREPLKAAAARRMAVQRVATHGMAAPRCAFVTLADMLNEPQPALLLSRLGPYRVVRCPDPWRVLLITSLPHTRTEVQSALWQVGRACQFVTDDTRYIDVKCDPPSDMGCKSEHDRPLRDFPGKVGDHKINTNRDAAAVLGLMPMSEDQLERELRRIVYGTQEPAMPAQASAGGLRAAQHDEGGEAVAAVPRREEQEEFNSRRTRRGARRRSRRSQHEDTREESPHGGPDTLDVGEPVEVAASQPEVAPTVDYLPGIWTFEEIEGPDPEAACEPRTVSV